MPIQESSRGKNDTTVGIAADHGGRVLKQHVVGFLQKQGFAVCDFGVSIDHPHSVDYPDYAALLGDKIASGELSRGIAICGTGIGMAIALNKIAGCRAVSVWDEFTARMTREHNDANVICLGERVLNHERALDFLKIWLDTPFLGGRHQARVDKIANLESRR